MNFAIRKKKKSDLPIVELLGESVYSPGMMPPPSEKLPQVIQFQLTTGCRHGKCTYCDLYRAKRYTQKGLDEMKAHIDDVWKQLKKHHPERIPGLTRIFIGSGNALGAMDNSEMVRLMHYLIKKFYKHVGRYPKRIAAYSNTLDIIRSKNGLDAVRCTGTCTGRCSSSIFGQKLGLNLLYWGVESGSSEVLRYVNKGYDYDDILKANDIRQGADMRISVMIMVGLGGHKYYHEHLNETVRVLKEIQPEFITFLGINPAAHTAYAKKMEEEIKAGTNRPLTDRELVKQMMSIIERLDFGATIGCFGQDVTPTAHNPFTFGSIEMDYWRNDGMMIVESLGPQLKEFYNTAV